MGLTRPGWVLQTFLCQARTWSLTQKVLIGLQPKCHHFLLHPLKSGRLGSRTRTAASPRQSSNLPPHSLSRPHVRVWPRWRAAGLGLPSVGLPLQPKLPGVGAFTRAPRCCPPVSPLFNMCHHPCLARPYPRT